MKKCIILTFMLTLSLNLFASTLKQSYKFKFKYQSFDGQIVKSCTYSPINEWYDYNVLCDDKIFSVHLLVRKQHRSIAPKTLIEVLYWINNKSIPGKIEGTGTSVWFSLNEKTGFSEITLSQSTESDTAGLYLDITPY